MLLGQTYILTTHTAHRQTDRHTHSYTHRHRHTQTQTHTHTHTQRHTHTHRHTHTQTFWTYVSKFNRPDLTIYRLEINKNYKI